MEAIIERPDTRELKSLADNVEILFRGGDSFDQHDDRRRAGGGR